MHGQFSSQMQVGDFPKRVSFGSNPRELNLRVDLFQKVVRLRL